MVRSHGRRASYRPEVESLEARALPSTLSGGADLLPASRSPAGANTVSRTTPTSDGPTSTAAGQRAQPGAQPTTGERGGAERNLAALSGVGQPAAAVARELGAGRTQLAGPAIGGAERAAAPGNAVAPGAAAPARASGEMAGIAFLVGQREAPAPTVTPGPGAGQPNPAPAAAQSGARVATPAPEPEPAVSRQAFSAGYLVLVERAALGPVIVAEQIVRGGTAAAFLPDSPLDREPTAPAPRGETSLLPPVAFDLLTSLLPVASTDIEQTVRDFQAQPNSLRVCWTPDESRTAWSPWFLALAAAGTACEVARQALKRRSRPEPICPFSDPRC